MGRVLDDSPLTPAAYRLLAYLSSDAVAAAVLAEKLAVSRPTVTATTDWLEARGLVVRIADTTDRRRIAIEMTDAGREALDDADALIGVRLAEVLAHIEESEADQVLKALELLHPALNNFRARSHAVRARSRERA